MGLAHEERETPTVTFIFSMPAAVGCRCFPLSHVDLKHCSKIVNPFHLSRNTPPPLRIKEPGIVFVNGGSDKEWRPFSNLKMRAAECIQNACTCLHPPLNFTCWMGSSADFSCWPFLRAALANPQNIKVLRAL